MWRKLYQSSGLVFLHLIIREGSPEVTDGDVYPPPLFVGFAYCNFSNHLEDVVGSVGGVGCPLRVVQPASAQKKLVLYLTFLLPLLYLL